MKKHEDLSAELLGISQLFAAGRLIDDCNLPEFTPELAAKIEDIRVRLFDEIELESIEVVFIAKRNWN